MIRMPNLIAHEVTPTYRLSVILRLFDINFPTIGHFHVLFFTAMDPRSLIFMYVYTVMYVCSCACMRARVCACMCVCECVRVCENTFLCYNSMTINRHC